jgi:hypothetical protein
MPFSATTQSQSKRSLRTRFVHVCADQKLCLNQLLKAEQIAHQLLPNRATPRSALQYLRPILDAYQNDSYSALETAIFPGYFHGKCQVNGIDPSGCPDPDCPVVCGTPGSLVHFYAKLVSIVFDCIQDRLASLVSPGSKAYSKVERTLLAEAGNMNKNEKISFTKRMENILRQLPVSLGNVCGGADDVPRCSWETEMKAFILSFP